MSDDRTHPHLVQVVMDTTDARGLAEFYRQLLGLEHRPGDEPPPAGAPDPKGRDWLCLRRNGRSVLAFALALGARLLLDRADDEPRYVCADPSGHPFCVFVG